MEREAGYRLAIEDAQAAIAFLAELTAAALAEAEAWGADPRIAAAAAKAFDGCAEMVSQLAPHDGPALTVEFFHQFRSRGARSPSATEADDTGDALAD